MATLLEILGFTVGLFYLWFEYHADKRVWITSLIMPVISMWIYFSKGLYADFAINIYYLLIAGYGYFAWTREKSSTEDSSHTKDAALRISHLPFTVGIVTVLAMVAIWYALWWLLSLTDSTVPVADAFTTAMSIVGMWLLARKYIEQWAVWFIVDAVCVWLYFYKGIYFYATLYAIYTVISVFGYVKWHKLMKAQS